MVGGVSDVYAFDVATVPDQLERDGGHRDLSPVRWTRILIASHGLVDAHLAAAQMAGRSGRMTIEVLYRE